MEILIIILMIFCVASWIYSTNADAALIRNESEKKANKPTILITGAFVLSLLFFPYGLIFSIGIVIYSFFTAFKKQSRINRAAAKKIRADIKKQENEKKEEKKEIEKRVLENLEENHKFVQIVKAIPGQAPPPATGRRSQYEHNDKFDREDFANESNEVSEADVTFLYPDGREDDAELSERRVCVTHADEDYITGYDYDRRAERTFRTNRITMVTIESTGECVYSDNLYTKL